jgi:transposase-like protein
MTPPAAPQRYQHHRCPGEMIRHGGWLSYRFPLRSRDGPEILCERGITVTHAALRQGCLTFGQADAHPLQHRRAQPGAKGHWDEGCLTINGKPRCKGA